MKDQTLATGLESSAWTVQDGVLLNPLSHPGGGNTPTESDNSYYKVTMRGKPMNVADVDGTKHMVHGHIHTHPKSEAGPYYWDSHNRLIDGGDYRFSRTYPSIPIFTVGPTKVHRAMNGGLPAHVNWTQNLLGGSYIPR